MGFGVGASQFAGGQFMQTHQDGGQEKAQDENTTDSMRSLTINQLVKSQQHSQGSNVLYCDGRNVTQVTIVGVLTGKIPAETFNILTVYDGTGTIEVRQFKDDDENQERLNMLVENTYVRVYGTFKLNHGDGPANPLGHINAFSIRAVEDHNEVVHHQLDVIFQHLYLTQSQNMPGAGNMAGGYGGFPMSMPGAPTGGNVLQQHAGGGLKATDVVHAFLADQGHGASVSLPDIVRGLAGQLSEDVVKSAVLELERDGRAYTAQGDEYAAC